MKTKKILLLTCSVITVGLGFTSCNKSNEDYDASGTFETTEVLVSSEAVGKILRFDIEEGMQLTENQIIGNIDSTQLFLKMQQLKASQKALISRRPDKQKQIAMLEQQLATARTEKNRIEKLIQANAIGTKQADDINAQIALLEKQLEATKSTLTTTLDGIAGDNSALDIQLQQLEDQLAKCRIISPISGTVLNKYAERGELAAAGRALFKIADMNNMLLRAYITSDQLTTIKTGQKVQVLVDFGENEKSYEGVISWISSKSEFTPKTIQTRDERANLVYAVKISVKNDGYLKIGQYGSVKF